MKPLELMRPETFAKLEHRARPLLVQLLHEDKSIELFSQGREDFLEEFKNEEIDEPVNTEGISGDLPREFWGQEFQSPLMNAAGMFKDDLDDYYQIAVEQGAGAFMAGTYTPEPRKGNEFEFENPPIRCLKDYLELQLFGPESVSRPAVSLPRSGASINSLGLPNPGFRSDREIAVEAGETEERYVGDIPVQSGEGTEVRLEDVRQFLGYERSAAEEVENIERVDGCPVGVSIMGKTDDMGTEDYARQVCEGLEVMDDAGADFAEINESCPNTEHERPEESGLSDRLEYIADNYLEDSSMPVVVKLSPDIEPEQIRGEGGLVDMLVGYGFAGVNFCNTSKSDGDREYIDEKERNLYDRFKEVIGGGVGGKPLKERSLRLSSEAAIARNAMYPDSGFAVFRTGGVETGSDIVDSEVGMVDMNQWFTGLWDGYGEHGNQVYAETLEGAV